MKYLNRYCKLKWSKNAKGIHLVVVAGSSKAKPESKSR